MERRIYIGNLPPDVRTKDVEDLFQKYGKMNFVNVKNSKGPPFAFIEFEDVRDASDAVKGRDGYNYEGHKLRVEFSKGTRSENENHFRPRDGGFGNATGGMLNKMGRRTEYRCLISGLPPTGSWQDLKDHMRIAGNVCRSDVFKDGTGVIEFTRYDDMKYAVRELDNSKFRSHEGETSYIRVRIDPNAECSISQSRTRSRSPIVRRNQRTSPSYSPTRRRSRRHSHSSRSRTRTRTRSITRSHSNSRSRSRTRSRSLRRSRSKQTISRSRSRSRNRNRSRSVEYV